MVTALTIFVPRDVMTGLKRIRIFTLQVDISGASGWLSRTPSIPAQCIRKSLTTSHQIALHAVWRWNLPDFQVMNRVRN